MLLSLPAFIRPVMKGFSETNAAAYFGLLVRDGDKKFYQIDTSRIDLPAAVECSGGSFRTFFLSLLTTDKFRQNILILSQVPNGTHALD